MVESDKSLQERRQRAHRQFMQKKHRQLRPRDPDAAALIPDGPTAQGASAVAGAVTTGIPLA